MEENTQLYMMENDEQFSISLNQQLSCTQPQPCKMDLSKGPDKELFSQLACWVSALPLYAPGLILVFSTWGSSRGSKTACQHTSLSMGSQDRVNILGDMLSIPRMRAPEVPIPLPALLSLCNPFLSASLPRTLQRTGQEGRGGGGGGPSRCSADRYCGWCLTEVHGPARQAEGSQPSEELAREVTSGSHRHCLFFGCSASGCFLA